MQTTTFKTINIQPLETIPYPPRNRLSANELWKNEPTDTLLTYEETCPAHLRPAFNNGFFAAFYYAYNHHGDVKISPDDVWMAIMLFFSKYVNDNSEQLRNAFVSH